MELPRDGSSPRQVATRYLGNRIAAAGELLVFDQIEIVNNVALRSDLYAVAADGGAVRRITEHARAADPDVSPDGLTIVCTIQSADRRALATMPLPASGELATPAMLVSDEATHYWSPRWSPDGRWIAAERRRVGGPSEIVVVNAGTRETRTLVSSTDARNVTPFWLSNRTIVFASDRNGEPFGIYAADVATGATRKLTGAGISAQSPVVSADGRELVFVGYTADGYDLFSLPMASVVWTDVPAAAAAGARPPVAPPDAIPAVPDTPYRPWRTLAPQFWAPVIESDSGETTAGAATGGLDALGRHGYATTVTWAATRITSRLVGRLHVQSMVAHAVCQHVRRYGSVA